LSGSDPEGSFYSRPVVVVRAGRGFPRDPEAVLPASGLRPQERVPEPQQFSLVKAWENMRGWLALGVLGVFGLQTACFFVLAFGHVVLMQDIKELGLLLFTPTVGILGTVLGFYFGADKAAGSSQG